jgi:uncharacterized protein (TIGR00255 family)
MTAYARITEENSWGSITCELRSVNHRFLEVGFRMPDVLRESETALRDMARKKLTRGKIDCSVQIAFNHSDAGSTLDLEVAQSHIEIAQAIANKLSDAAPISAVDIMQLPWGYQRCQYRSLTGQQSRQKGLRLSPRSDA